MPQLTTFLAGFVNGMKVWWSGARRQGANSGSEDLCRARFSVDIWLALSVRQLRASRVISWMATWQRKEMMSHASDSKTFQISQVKASALNSNRSQQILQCLLLVLISHAGLKSRGKVGTGFAWTRAHSHLWSLTFSLDSDSGLEAVTSILFFQIQPK